VRLLAFYPTTILSTMDLAFVRKFFYPPNPTPLPITKGLASQSTQELLPRQPPFSPESQSHSPQQEQQPRPVNPWSEHYLNLWPPTLLSNKLTPGPSPSPFPRYGYALSATASPTGELFLFGGTAHNSPHNDLYMISTRDLSATLLQTSGEVPSPRFGPAGALIGIVLLIWGGATYIGKQSVLNKPEDDSLYLLNLSKSDHLVSIPTLAD
jgi:hypothetical protein